MRRQPHPSPTTKRRALEVPWHQNVVFAQFSIRAGLYSSSAEPHFSFTVSTIDRLTSNWVCGVSHSAALMVINTQTAWFPITRQSGQRICVFWRSLVKKEGSKPTFQWEGTYVGHINLCHYLSFSVTFHRVIHNAIKIKWQWKMNESVDSASLLATFSGQNLTGNS